LSDEARYVLANHLFSKQPLDDWDMQDLLDAGLVTQGELEALPDPDPMTDPRMYWRYVGTAWDVVSGDDGQPQLVAAGEGGAVAFDLTGFLRGLLDIHLNFHEPLRENDVRAIVAVGLASADEFENRGGGCFWHHSIPEE